ncbi:DUF4365 domain-containing protein [Lentzea sp. NPDC054927]
MNRPLSAEIAAVAVAEAHLAVTKKLRWTFRSLDGDDDYGLDALVEIGRNREMTGRLLALQIKGGRSYFDRPAPLGWWHYPTTAHVEYWLNCSLPVLLVMYDPASEQCHWQLISLDTLTQTSKGQWKLLVPRAQVLDETAIEPLHVIAGKDVGSDRIEVTTPIAAEPQEPPRRAMVVARHNQARFRKALIARYGFACAVTGPCPAELIQVAHLIPLKDRGAHSVNDVVLLRADVHQLFDRGLMAVDPATWRVVVSPVLKDVAAYAGLAGVRFGEGPDPEAVRRHFEEATADW